MQRDNAYRLDILIARTTCKKAMGAEGPHELPMVQEEPVQEQPLQAHDGRFRRSGGFLTRARKNRIISLNGACDDESESSRGTASANGAAA